MKKAFSLIELLISIVLFSLLLLFLYKTLDFMMLENESFKNIVTEELKNKDFQSTLLEDSLESSYFSTGYLNGNLFFTFKSQNILHYPFNNYITYIYLEDKLYRIESQYEFLEKNKQKDFYKHIYVDILMKNIKKVSFESIKTNHNNKVLTILKNDGTVLLFQIMMI